MRLSFLQFLCFLVIVYTGVGLMKIIIFSVPFDWEANRGKIENIIDEYRRMAKPMSSEKKYEVKKYRNYYPLKIESPKIPSLRRRTDCKSELWGVTTTINYPTKAIKQIGDLGFCCVVVGDKKTPKDWQLNATNIVFLDASEHHLLGFEIERITPFNSFARKALGYLFAIQHGAESIYDFDDDNFFLDPATAVSKLNQENSTFIALESNHPTTNVYTHYMDHPITNIWPRGYPMEAIKSDEVVITKPIRKPRGITIVQFLQNRNPDLDAIYRMTQKIPLEFSSRRKECVRITSYCSFNAQATWFDKSVFWALLLPMTVNGRVSDIWRSYIAQRVLKIGSGAIAFCPALVEHERNPHRLIRDFTAEIPLYLQTTAFVNWLIKLPLSNTSRTEAMKQVYIGMYENGLLGIKDVEMCELWLRDYQRVTEFAERNG